MYICIYIYIEHLHPDGVLCFRTFVYNYAGWKLEVEDPKLTPLLSQTAYLASELHNANPL